MNIFIYIYMHVYTYIHIHASIYSLDSLARALCFVGKVRTRKTGKDRDRQTDRQTDTEERRLDSQ